MNPAITAALIAAAHEEEFDNSVTGKLREAKATGPSSAIPLQVDPDKQDGWTRRSPTGRSRRPRTAVSI